MIPVNMPLLDGNEIKYLTECVKSGWVSSEGPFIRKFEEDFAKYIGCEFGVAVANGTAALDIALAALDIGPGDEIILPTFTIISPIMQVVRSGATPVLVDSKAETWNMDVDEVVKKITKKTRAIIAVHIYGLPVDMNPLLEVCRENNIILIEDAAEMHGQTYFGKMIGSIGDISTFSFYPNKHITTGEGGMILTNNADLFERFKKLRNLAFEPDKQRFVHYELGWNYRMTNMQAAIGLAQLEKINSHLNKKRQIGQFYNDNLILRNGPFTSQLLETDYAENIYWVYGLLANYESEKLKMVEYLTKYGIGTRPFFWCMHEQPVFRKMGLFSGEKFPVAEHLARCGFYLPSGLGLELNQLKMVSEKFNDGLNLF
jgi:perosamine synthetase